MVDTESGLQPAFLANGGDMGRLIARFDWATTPIGALDGWPDAMKAVIAFILRSPIPMVTLWGDTGVMIYNDHYRGFAAERHPAVLGSNVLEGWPEVASFNANVMRTVYRNGGTLTYKDQELVLTRDGTPRAHWFDLVYSPAFDADGHRLGVIATVFETTEKVTADRLLRDERRRLLQMAEHSPSFMALLEGPEHRITIVNPAYQRLVGDRDLIGRPWAEALPDAVEQGFRDLLDHVRRTGKAFSATGARYLARADPDGPTYERFVDFAYQPLKTGDEVSGIFISGVDVTDRAKAMAAVNASEAQLRVFAQTLPNHIWTASPEGRFDWFNDQILTYMDDTHDALIAQDWLSFVHADDADFAQERWDAAIASGRTYQNEFRIRGADGSYRWFLVRALPIRDDEGRIIRWIGTNTDIHEQMLAQAESMADRNRLWALSRDLLLVCTFDGLITAVNPSATRMLGWSPDEMIGRRVGDFLHPADVLDTGDELEKLGDGVATLAFENRYRTRTGDYRLIAWTAVPEAGRVHAVGRDITAERALARDRERIWSLSPVLAAVTDDQGLITDVNPSWTAVLGWSREETLGKRSVDFMIDGDNAWADRVRALRRGEQLNAYETPMRTKGGDRRLVRWSTVPDGGRFYGFGRDVTAEAEAAAVLAETEAALRQAQKMEAVGQLTGGIAHDFNNLLQGIGGSLEILQRRVAQGRTGELDRHVAAASAAADRAASLTHRLLAFSRRQPIAPKPIRANSLIASMEELLRRTIGERIDLELALAGGLWMTRCDSNQLESAILNLVINARDAMPDGGRLTIETCNAHLDTAYAARQRDVNPGQYVCLCVSDTGTGMDADTAAKAFEPFFTTKPIGKGTGLGLSMIYGFAKQSEGYAKIYSEPGQGTTFRLYLPRHRGGGEEAEAPPRASEAPAADEGQIVLIIEDEALVRGLIVDELQELGYAVLEAVDGIQGLEILESGRPVDLLLTDIGLPGLNGRQVADRARELRPDLRILFMTGYAENAALAAGFLEPGMELITKPFAMDALATRIRAMLEGAPSNC